MNRIKNFFRRADTVLMAFSFLIAGITIMYCGYVLYDVVYTNQNAYTSFDMMKYKREIEQQSNASSSSFWYDQGGFSALKKLNPDVVGWLEMYDTNINYPVVQGDDDLEYASKDFKGNGSISGSIYLSAFNSPDMSDGYNIIYGHHMANGAMFGDVEKFLDKKYFDRHLDGSLQTPDGNYKLRVFACMFTDAYDSSVYTVHDGTFDSYPELLSYIEENADVLDSEYLDGHTPEKVTVLSTCGSAVTNGRIVLFADTVPTDYLAQMFSDDNDLLRAAIGHILNNNNSHWAFLNLLCTVLTFLVLLPVFRIRSKYYQRRYSSIKIDEIDSYTEWVESGGGQVPELVTKVFRNLKNFLVRSAVGIVIEILFVLAAVIAFLLTENIFQPMVMSDNWTWLMVLIFALALLADIICFRFYGKHPYMIDDILEEFAENQENGENVSREKPQPATV